MPTYNSLQRGGEVITDPPYLFSLELEGIDTPAEFPLGDFTAGYTASELIGYLAMRGWSVPIKNQREWVEKHKPVLVWTILETGEERRFDHTGKQLFSA